MKIEEEITGLTTRIAEVIKGMEKIQSDKADRSEVAIKVTPDGKMDGDGPLRKLLDEYVTKAIQAGSKPELSELERKQRLFTALAKAQGEIANAALDANNPHFDSKYSSFGAVRDVSRAALAKHGLGIVQMPEVTTDGKYIALTTVVFHSDGGDIRSRLVIPITKSDAQGIKSATTYAKRIAYEAMLCVASVGEDDDAEGAVGRGSQHREKKDERREEPKSRPQAGPKPKPAEVQKYEAKEEPPKKEEHVPKSAEHLTKVELQALVAAAQKANWKPADVTEVMSMAFDKKASGDLTRSESHVLFDLFKKEPGAALTEVMEARSKRESAEKTGAPTE